MLVMSRKVLESIKFGDEITLTITRIRGNRVTVAIEAPKSVPVHRSEVYDKNKAKGVQDEQDNQ